MDGNPAKISITGCMNSNILFDENCVKNKAANKQTGIDKLKAIKVTCKEPIIKDKKPNFFSCGNHVEEQTKSFNEESSNKGLAFEYKPITITNGKARMIPIEKSIHIEDILSNSFLLKYITR